MLGRIICLLLDHKWKFIGRIEMNDEYGPNYDPGTEVYVCVRCGLYCKEGDLGREVWKY